MLYIFHFSCDCNGFCHVSVSECSLTLTLLQVLTLQKVYFEQRQRIDEAEMLHVYERIMDVMRALQRPPQ